MKSKNALIYDPLAITEKKPINLVYFLHLLHSEVLPFKEYIIKEGNKSLSVSMKLEFWNALRLLTKQRIFVLKYRF